MHRSLQFLLFSSVTLATDACAQAVFHDDEVLGSDRPEAWAMNYFAGATFMTAFGETPALAPGQWDAALELGHIPRLSQAQRQVGFRGFKREDLNRSPVFGRLRLRVGLPARWVAELGYTPPLAIDGTRTRNLVALAVGRRLIERERFSLSARAFGQHGSAAGDITCPSDLAGVEDGERNPYGCQAPSNDRLSLNYYGVDLTPVWTSGAWRWHGSVGVARTELQVQVDALTFDLHDRSRLTANGVVPLLAAGVRRDLNLQWSMAAEVMHVPLSVRRETGGSREQDALTSVRLQLRYRPR